MAKQQANVSTRGIGLELQRHRKAAKLSCAAVGAQLGTSGSTISRIETGRREPTSEEVASILTAIGVTGVERERLIDLARRGGESSLLESNTHTSQSRTYRNFEVRATKIIDVEPLLVPGLAQTPDYARAIISATQVDEGDDDIEARVANRMARKAILTRPKPPELVLILTEAALRTPLGSPKIMAEQVRHLAELSERPNISISVIPVGVVGHAALAGPFVILSFKGEPTIVHVEARTKGLFLDDSDEIGIYRLTVEKLTDVALDKEKSVRLMTSIAHDLARE